MATSGDSAVVLLGHPAVALVRAVGAISRAPVGPYAIVGGVAVAVRLGTAHRATNDVDTVVHDRSKPAAVEVLSALAGAVRDVATDHRVFLDGVSGAARTSGWMRSGDEVMGSVTADQLRAVGGPLLDSLVTG